MPGRPPGPDPIEDGDTGDACQHGQRGEPDTLPAFCVGKERRAAAQNIQGKLAIKRTRVGISNSRE
jgi:hypothetical protein